MLSYCLGRTLHYLINLLAATLVLFALLSLLIPDYSRLILG